uniref:Uncharacterized protein n=1 Tax=Amphimedon queenslandica TaxID=400682 RepID=A0A1X7TMC2_AMPQE
MTDGGARLIKVMKLKDTMATTYNRLTSRDPSSFWTSGKWMTERVGGSDVAEADALRVEWASNIEESIPASSRVVLGRLELKCYFANILQKKTDHLRDQTDKQKVKPTFYGEALTTDEMHQQLTAAEEKTRE